MTAIKTAMRGARSRAAPLPADVPPISKLKRNHSRLALINIKSIILQPAADIDMLLHHIKVNTSLVSTMSAPLRVD